MARGKKHTPEQIVSLLRQVEVGVGSQVFNSNGAMLSMAERWLIARAPLPGPHDPPHVSWHLR